MDLFFLVGQFSFHLIVIIVLIFVTVYAYFKISYTYWARKDVAYLKPTFPLGNNVCIGFEAHSYGLETVDWYNQLKQRGLKYGGVWSFAKPVLMIIDPEYIKDILVKDFDYFSDRDFYHNPKHDPKNENLFVIESEKWKNLRQKLTPVFTTTKMRMMFAGVVKCSEPMIDVIEGYAKSGEYMEIKEITAAFTTDVVGSVAFGLDFQSFRGDAKFRQLGKEIFNSNFKSKIFLVMSRLCNKLAQNLGIVNIPQILTESFTEVISKNVKYRKSQTLKVPDYLQLLIELFESTENEKQRFTFEDLIANVIMFFLAGFETSATTMHFALYELSVNPDIQEKVRKEINTVLENHHGELTYEALMEMTYLRQVLDETLRKYPALQALSRICVKPYKLRNTKTTIDPGTTVVVSAIAVGRDPEHFPNPDKFDPDRFSAENKGNMNPYTYLPFGIGPRNCIGKRFGLMQSSIGLVQILRKFKLSLSPETKTSLTLRHGLFIMVSNETVYLKAERV